jgi:hypothetical protein
MESIIRDVNNDAKWEETVFDTVTGYATMPIFLQDNKKREEMNRHLSYWRDRRNDAAHAKENEISYAHVESFWIFMQSNIPKLVVRGSRAAIFETIEKHFDKRFTPKNTDFSHIMQQIKHSLYEEDLIIFYQDVKEIFEEIDPFFMVFVDQDMNKFWDEILKIGEPFSSQLVRYLKSEDSFDVFNTFIMEYTHRIALFHEEHQFIYNLWYEKIKKFGDPYKLIAALLRNNLIEERNKKTAIKKLILNLNNEIPSDPLDYKILIEHGYIIDFRELVFGVDVETDALINQFGWGNENLNPVRHYLSNSGLDKEVVLCLNSVFRSQPYPRKMCANLKDIFSINEELIKEFIRIAEELGVTPPTSLGFKEE